MITPQLLDSLELLYFVTFPFKFISVKITMFYYPNFFHIISIFVCSFYCFSGLIADMPYKTRASEEELLEMLPHKWKASHPEAIITKEE